MKLEELPFPEGLKIPGNSATWTEIAEAYECERLKRTPNQHYIANDGLCNALDFSGVDASFMIYDLYGYLVAHPVEEFRIKSKETSPYWFSLNREGELARAKIARWIVVALESGSK